MSRIELCAPCHFGLERVLRWEIEDLGYKIISVEDGRVTFESDELGICRANMFLRTPERILWNVGRFHAEDFDDLFDGTMALPWEEYIPADARFWVTKAACVSSNIHSSSTVQSMVKKAIVRRLEEKYNTGYFPEEGFDHPIRVFIRNNEVSISLDTTGESLHKRGYRKLVSDAPIAENLAAALIRLTPWKSDRILVDPFCGSGTIPIEAAMMAAGIAPGMNRHFTAENWDERIDFSLWQDTQDEAMDLVKKREDIHTDIQGYDIDDKVLSLARAHARAAGVEDLIHFQRRDVAELSHSGKYGFIITNPPYGGRIEDVGQISKLYKDLGSRFRELDTWSMYVITAYEDAQKDIGSSVGRKADKNRKIYNGMIKTYYYQYIGPKPPKRDRETVQQ